MALETEKIPKKCQLELVGTESEDRLETISLCDAVKMYEFAKSTEVSKYFYQPRALDAAKGVYVTNALEKQCPEEKQLELYDDGGP